MPVHKILLIEDYGPNIMVATTFLEEWGFAYDVAHTGQEALDRMAAEAYDVVLMDIQMSDMDGVEVTRRIRAREQELSLPPVAILAVTAHALRGDAEKFIGAGMNDYLAKPYPPDDLRRRILALIDGRAS